jgi:hypothetical protein
MNHQPAYVCDHCRTAEFRNAFTCALCGTDHLICERCTARLRDVVLQTHGIMCSRCERKIKRKLDAHA